MKATLINLGWAFVAGISIDFVAIIVLFGVGT